MRWLLLTVGLFLVVGCATSTKVEKRVETVKINVQPLLKKEKTLSNGLHIIAVQKKKLPIFHMQLTIRTGSFLDPKGKEGTANLVGVMIDEGTKNRTSEQIASEIEDIGGYFSVSVGKTHSEVSLRCLADDIDRMLDIASDVIMNPTFPEKEFQRERRRQRSSIQNNLSNPNYVARVRLYELLYEGTRLSHPSEGYVFSVDSITREDLIKFHNTYWRPNLAYVVVVSSLDPGEAIAKVEKYLSRWERKEVQLPDIPNFKRERKVIVEHMPGLNQAYVRLAAFVDIQRNSPDWNALRVANYILGGSGFSSRILKKIRVEKGYAYSAYSYIIPNIPWKHQRLPSVFIGGLETRIETAEDAVLTLLDLIKEAKEKGFTEEELEAAKSFYNGYIARTSETYSQVASLLSTQYEYGLPDMFWIKDVEEISRLTLQKVNAAARKYLNTEDYILLILTDTTHFKPKSLK
ncbi:MAG: insulinase family protein [Thermotogae bacterium]|nr:insulinase family protein [Thermotogota bacterium]